MNLNQHVFVTEYLRHRDKIIAYATAYQLQSTRNATVIESAANRLLRTPEIAEEIRKTYDAVRHEVEQEIRAELKTQLLTVQRKRELLAQIATGEMSVLQYYKGKNCSQCSQYIQPTINQMLAAIKEDSKLAGHYPENKPAKNAMPKPAKASEEVNANNLYPAYASSAVEENEHTTAGAQQITTIGAEVSVPGVEQEMYAGVLQAGTTGNNHAVSQQNTTTGSVNTLPCQFNEKGNPVIATIPGSSHNDSNEKAP